MAQFNLYGIPNLLSESRRLMKDMTEEEKDKNVLESRREGVLN